MTHSQTTVTDQVEKILKSWGLKKRHLAGRDFWSPWSVDKRRNVPGNISSIRQQCAVCENLIRPALIRADETLSHFSRRLRTTSPPSIEPPAGEKIQLLARSRPFLLGLTILRNSYCTLELFCCPVLLGPHFAWAMWRGAFCRGWQKGGWPYGRQ